MLRVFAHFWPSVRKYRSWCNYTIVTMIIGICIDASYPFLLRIIINEVSNNGQVEIIWKALFYIIGLYIAGNIAWRLFDFGIVRFESLTMKDLDARCFQVLQQQSMEYFASNFGGALVKKVTQFRSAFEGMTDIAFFQYGKNLILICFILITFLLEMPILALLLSLWLIIFVIINVGLSWWKYPQDMNVSASDAKISGYLADSLGNHAVVKNWGMEQHEYARLTTKLDENFTIRKKAWDTNSLINGIQGVLMASVQVLTLWILIRSWEQGGITVGDFVFFNSYILWLFSELWGFGNSLRRWYFFSADAEKMCDILEQHSEVPEKTNARPLLVTRAAITLDDVRFSYPSDVVASQKSEEDDQSDEAPKKITNRRGAVQGISLEVSPGESIGLIGESGSGKSTIVKLLMRYYDVSSGAILIDNQNIKDVTIQSLRQSIGLVPQEAEMFHRSLLENIRFGKPEANEAEVMNAAKKAHAWEFIRELEHGLATKVGERGVKLSGGQRQRIALARAFLVNAPILILDEATSALDSETEKHIQEAISDLITNRTSIIIAHRLSTIMKLDRIIVLDNGTILEEGSHEQLLTRNGKYASLWAHQTGGYIGETV